MTKCLINENLIFNNLEYPLYHVGSMDIKKKSRHSYEGNGLSVSICPSAWESIARISNSKVWKLEKEDMKLLDYYEVPREVYDSITKWGIENGYLEEVYGRYAYSYYSEELGRDVSILCDNFTDAMEEVCLEDIYATYEDYLNSDDGDEETVYPVKSYKATDKLQDSSLIEVDEGKYAEEQNFLLYLEKYTDYDGVYWDEELDVLGLTAPRGVIFNNKLNSFNISLVSNDDCFEADDIQNQLFDY